MAEHIAETLQQNPLAATAVARTAAELVEIYPGLKQTRLVDQLLTAKAAFTAECPPSIEPDSTGRVGAGGERKYAYVSQRKLNSIVNPIMGKHGLSIDQYQIGDHEIVTLLSHSSGQQRAALTDISNFINPISKRGERGEVDAKVVGIAITYARRYLKCAILDVAAETDDESALHAATEGAAPTRPPFKPDPTAGNVPGSTAPPRDPGARKPNIPPANNTYFGDDKKGVMKTWIHSCEVLRSGKGGRGPWSLYEVVTVAGERFRTFNDGDAGTLTDCSRTGVACVIQWTLETKDQYSNYMIDSASPLTADEQKIAVGSITVKIERITAAENKKGAGLVTSRGRFAAEGEGLVAALVGTHDSDADVRFSYHVTKRGRLIHEILTTDTTTPPTEESTDGNDRPAGDAAEQSGNEDAGTGVGTGGSDGDEHIPF